MKTCKICKYWDKDGRSSTDLPIEYKSCSKEYAYEYHPDGSPQDLNKAGVGNGEPYNAGTLMTGPDFGCIHHEETTLPT